jgi:hypothetical protein
MIRKLITSFLIIGALFSAPLLVTEVDAQALNATVAKPTVAGTVAVVAKATPVEAVKTTVKKPVAKKTTTTKKKVTKKSKKPKVIARPALITVDTAPHSPKPVAKKSTKKK